MSEEDRAKAEQYREIATRQLLGRDDSLPEEFHEPVSLENIFAFAELTTAPEIRGGRGYLTKQAAAMAHVPFRVAFALRPKKPWVKLFVGWPPFDAFQEILGEVRDDLYRDYQDFMERVSHKAYREVERAVDGEYGEDHQIRAAWRILDRKHGKPTERVERKSLTIDVNAEISGEELAQERRFISDLGVDRTK